MRSMSHARKRRHKSGFSVTDRYPIDQQLDVLRFTASKESAGLNHWHAREVRSEEHMKARQKRDQRRQTMSWNAADVGTRQHSRGAGALVAGRGTAFGGDGLSKKGQFV